MFDHIIYKFKNKIFLICWLDCELNGKYQYKKKEHNQHSSMFSVKITFILFKCHGSADNVNDFYLFYFAIKNIMITKNPVVKCQNFAMNHESRPVNPNPEVPCETSQIQHVFFIWQSLKSNS